MAIRPLGEVAKKAFSTLNRYQLHKSNPVITNRVWLDNVFGGLIPGDIVTIAGQSGGGKSFELQRIKNTVMDVNVNPEATDFVWLDNSWEMRFLSNILRDLKQKLSKSKKSILTETFTDEEKSLVGDYYKNLCDGRFFINEETVTPSAFENDCREFLSQHTDKKGVFISVDHIALSKDDKAGDKKNSVDGIIEVINRLKKEFPNSYWIILSQMNRNILSRIKDKDVTAMPNRSDLFQSDTIFHISDYVYCTHNPYHLGIKMFSRVNTEAYEHLERYFVEEKNGKASFDTLGNIFYIVLKAREEETFYKNIFIEEIASEDEKKRYKDSGDSEEQETKLSYNISQVKAPVFSDESKDALSQVGGIDAFEEENKPF